MRFLNKTHAGKETCALISKTFKDLLKKKDSTVNTLSSLFIHEHRCTMATFQMADLVVSYGSLTLLFITLLNFRSNIRVTQLSL